MEEKDEWRNRKNGGKGRMEGKEELRKWKNGAK